MNNCPIDHEDIVELLKLVIDMIVNHSENDYVKTNTLGLAIQILEKEPEQE